MADSLYLLDTDTLIFMIRALKAGSPGERQWELGRNVLARVREHMSEGVRVCVSAVTVSELEFGAAVATHPIRERRAVSKILSPFELLEYDAVNAPRHYGEIRAALRASGNRIGAMDLMIAAHVRSVGATVVTNNIKEFQRVAGLRCVNWPVA